MPPFCQALAAPKAGAPRAVEKLGSPRLKTMPSRTVQSGFVLLHIFNCFRDIVLKLVQQQAHKTGQEHKYQWNYVSVSWAFLNRYGTSNAKLSTEGMWVGSACKG